MGFVIAFLTIFWVSVLCSFRLLLEVKQVKEIPKSWRLEFLEKFLANSFALSDAEHNTSGPLNRGSIIVDLSFLRALLAFHQRSREPSFFESDWLFCFNSICKFGSFANPFAMITSQSELYFRYRRFILLVQMKKVITINFDSSTSSWKP